MTQILNGFFCSYGFNLATMDQSPQRVEYLDVEKIRCVKILVGSEQSPLNT